MAADFGEAVRRAMIATTLAEMFSEDASLYICPTCPGCNEGPAMALYHQCFCGNDDCSVWTWNPTEPREKFKATSTPVQVTERDGGRDVTWDLSGGDNLIGPGGDSE